MDDARDAWAANEVRLVGRVSVDPDEVILPSGDALWRFRLVVPRTPATPGRAHSDALECRVWGGRVRRSVATWRSGDVVEVQGALRRRFFAASGARASVVEVEVSRGRLVRRQGVE